MELFWHSLEQGYGTVFGTTWNTEDLVRRRATGLLKSVANSDHRSLLGLGRRGKFELGLKHGLAVLVAVSGCADLSTMHNHGTKPQ